MCEWRQTIEMIGFHCTNQQAFCIFSHLKKKVSAVSELLISFELFWSISKLHEKQLQWTKTISMNKVRPKKFLNVLKNGDSGNIMKALFQLKNRLLSIENTFANDRYSNGKDLWHSFPFRHWMFMIICDLEVSITIVTAFDFNDISYRFFSNQPALFTIQLTQKERIQRYTILAPK